MNVKSLASRLKKIFIIDNATCPICGRVLFSRDAFVCSNCERLFRVNNGPVCDCCGRAMTDEQATKCRECQRVENPAQAFDGGFAWLTYDDIAAKLMSGFKFHYQRELARWTGEQMARAAQADASAVLRTDVIVPVPLHPNRERERGYNQSAEIARGISEVTGIPVLAALVRQIDTPHQLGADRAFRLTNVAEAFAAAQPEKIAGRRVLLTDDVMTTGATLRACTRTLKNAGAAEVYVMVAAATL